MKLDNIVQTLREINKECSIESEAAIVVDTEKFHRKVITYLETLEHNVAGETVFSSNDALDKLAVDIKEASDDMMKTAGLEDEE